MDKKIFITAIIIGTLTFGIQAFAAPYYRVDSTILPHNANQDIGTSTRAWRGIYGQFFTATSTTASSVLPYASSTALTATTLFSNQAVFNGGPWVDARTCGAKGDGVTDDSSAINTCISDLAALGTGGGTLYLSATPGRSATTKYSVCTGPITMKSYVDVVVQTGVEIEVCNGYASSTVQFISGPNGTFYANWKGGLFREKGTPKKLWTAFNMESQNAAGGVFWNKVENVIIYRPSVCIRNAIVGSDDGWLNSNTYKDSVCNYPTNAFTFDDGGDKGLYGITNTKFDNVQLQADESTETCFANVQHFRTQIENSVCYDMNATSTSLSIGISATSTTVTGGFITNWNFVDNGTRTVITGDPLYPFYGMGASGSFYQNPSGQVMFGTTSSNFATEKVSIADGALTLGISTVSANSKIIFFRAGSAITQQDYMMAATTSGGNPNSGTIGISARESIVFNIDSDSTAGNTNDFCIRNNKAAIDILTANELFCVDELGRATFDYASTTVLTVTDNAYLGSGGSSGANMQTFIGATTTPFTFLNPTGTQNDAPLNVYRIDPVATDGIRTVANFIAAGDTPFNSANQGLRIDLGYASDAGMRIMSGISTQYDRPANFLRGRMNFWTTDNSAIMQNRGGINGLGNFAIGTSSEFINARAEIINIPGTTQDAFLVKNATSGFATTTAFVVDSGGDVGIGTTSPYAKLSVVGETVAAYFTATTTATSTFQGPIQDKGTKSITFNITSVTAAGDFGRIFKVPRAITITSVIVNQEGATNVIGQLQECDNNGANCAGVDSADITGTDGVDVTDDGTLSNPSIDINDYLGWTTTSVSGTNTRMSVTVRYVENF